MTQRRSIATLPAPAILALGLGADLASVSLMGKLIEGALKSPVRGFDHQVGRGSQRRNKAPLRPAMTALSYTGEPWTLYPVSGLVALRWLAQDRRADAATLGLALVGSAGLNRLIKVFISRPRPRFAGLGESTSGSSFPSQHIAMSLATYGTIAYLEGRRKGRRGRRRGARLWAPVLAFCGLIGLSRIYLGAHHPSDVLGGWVAGTIWLATCGLAHTRMQHPK